MSLLSIAREKIRGKHPFAEIYFKGKKTLDVGCGKGFFLNHDPEHFYGIDINQEALHISANRGLEVMMADASAIPFKDESFERVHCGHVIEHLTPEIARRMMEEMARVLRIGGIVLLSSELPTSRFWDTFSHIRPYPPTAIKKLLSEAHQETFPTLTPLQIRRIYYKGHGSRLKPLFWLFRLTALIGIKRRDYVMILQRVQ